MTSIFVCYSRRDLTIVSRLVRDLSQWKEINVWFSETRVLPGEPFDTRIREAIFKTDALLFCASRSTSVQKGGFLASEQAEILKRARRDPSYRIIPVKIEEGGGVPAKLSEGEYGSNLAVDFTETDEWSARVDKLANIILKEKRP